MSLSAQWRINFSEQNFLGDKLFSYESEKISFLNGFTLRETPPIAPTTTSIKWITRTIENNTQPPFFFFYILFHFSSSVSVYRVDINSSKTWYTFYPFHLLPRISFFFPQPLQSIFTILRFFFFVSFLLRLKYHRKFFLLSAK